MYQIIGVVVIHCHIRQAWSLSTFSKMTNYIFMRKTFSTKWRVVPISWLRSYNASWWLFRRRRRLISDSIREIPFARSSLSVRFTWNHLKLLWNCCCWFRYCWFRRGMRTGTRTLGYFIVDFHRTKRQKIQYARLDADETHTRYLVLRPSTWLGCLMSSLSQMTSWVRMVGALSSSNWGWLQTEFDV